MVRTIELSQNTFERLASIAEAFETPESVIQRLLSAYLGEEDKLEKKPSPYQGGQTRVNTQMTAEKIEAVYKMTSERFKANGPLNRSDITSIRDKLVKNMGLNQASAEIYISNLSRLLIGEFYVPSISQQAVRFFLCEIFSDFGKNALETALLSLMGHIENENKLGRPVPGLWAIHNEFSARLDSDNHEEEQTVITDKMIDKTYGMVSSSFRKNGPLQNDAIVDISNILISDEGMNEASAKMYVSTLSRMLIGETYRRNVSHRALEYFLNNIHSDFGEDTLEGALASLMGHIEYYEGELGINSPGLWRIHSEFSARLN